MYILDGSWVKNTVGLVRKVYKLIRFKGVGFNHVQRQKRIKAIHRKYLFIGTPIFFSLFFIITYYSYSLYYEQNLSSRREKIERVQTNVRQAMGAFTDFLDLQASRIEKSDLDGDEIIKILNTNPVSFIDSPLPTIVSLTVKINATGKVYSRLGEIVSSEASPNLKISTDEIFVNLDREINDVGLIKSKLSLKDLVPQDFREVLSSSPLQGADGFIVDANDSKLFVQLYEPYPTFRSFLYHYGSYVFLLALAMIASLYIGIMFASLSIRRRNKSLRLTNESLERKCQAQIERNLELVEENTQFKSRLVSYKKWAAMRELLLTNAITNYRTVSSNCYNTYNIVAHLLQNGFSDHHPAIMDIVNIAKGAHQELLKLSHGHPLTNVQHPVFLRQVVEDLIDGFSQNCQEIGVNISMSGQLQAVLDIDEGSLRVVIYNIMRHILRKYVTQISISIEKTETGFQIQFIDNGLETERMTCSESKNILSLSREEMIEIAQNMGWRITYVSDDGRCMTILWLPEVQVASANVVSLNDYRQHA